MKKIQSLLLNACAYTVIILALFYLFAATTGLVGSGIGFNMYALILGFGLLISFANLIFSVQQIKAPIKFFMHYAALFLAFLLIFVISGNISSKGSSAIFSSLIIFSFLYAIVFAIVYFCGKAVRAADKKVAVATAKKEAAKPKKASYKPIYSTEDKNENN